MKGTTSKISKKAQMEMVGIAIVVVLLVLGMALVFKALIKPASTTREEFQKEQAAQNILIAMGRSVSPCRGLDISELVQDCANNVGVYDDIGQFESDIQCSAEGELVDTCTYLNHSIRGIFKNTLELQKMPYRFFMYKVSRESPILYFDYAPPNAYPCNETSIKIKRVYDTENPGELYLPLQMGGQVYLELDICSTAKKG